MPNFAFVENVNIDSFFQKKKLRTFDNLNTMKYARLCLKKRDFTLKVMFLQASPSLLRKLSNGITSAFQRRLLVF